MSAITPTAAIPATIDRPAALLYKQMDLDLSSYLLRDGILGFCLALGSGRVQVAEGAATVCFFSIAIRAGETCIDDKMAGFFSKPLIQDSR